MIFVIVWIIIHFITTELAKVPKTFAQVKMLFYKINPLVKAEAQQL